MSKLLDWIVEQGIGKDGQPNAFGRWLLKAL